MEKEKDERAGDKAPYNVPHLVARFGISEEEVHMAMAEIHYAPADELEDYLKVKYRS